jgi:hypothetical protein
MFRIDPIDKYGNVDLKFFSSDEYSEEVRVLKKYLKDEGFDTEDKQFFIDFRNRKWEITPQKNKKKK